MFLHSQSQLLWKPWVHLPDKIEAHYGRPDLAVLWYHRWRSGTQVCKTSYCQVSEPCEIAVVKEILRCHPGHGQIASLICSAKHIYLEMLWVLFRSGPTLGSREHLEVLWGLVLWGINHWTIILFQFLLQNKKRCGGQGMCLYPRVCIQWGITQTKGGCVPSLPGPLCVVTDTPVWLASCIWSTACHGNGITVGETLGCLHPALYRMLRCSAASKKVKYMVVKTTSASGCLPLTVPKPTRRTRAEAGLGGGSKQVRDRKSRELWGLCAAQCGTSSQLAPATGTKRGQSHVCPSSVVLGPSVMYLWTQRECAHSWREIFIPSFIPPSLLHGHYVQTERAKVAFLDTSMENQRHFQLLFFFFPKGKPITSPFRIPEHLSCLRLGTLLTFASSLLSLIIQSKVGNCEACDLILV